MTGSPRDMEALRASRIGLSHWAGPSVTGSTGMSMGQMGVSKVIF